MKYILIILFSLFANILLSQVSWGFRVGHSFNTFKNETIYPSSILTSGSWNPSKIKSLIGLDFSIFIKYDINTKLSIQSEFHFLNKGGEIKHENAQATFYKLDVLESPLIFKYHFGKKKSFVPFLGASFGYRIGSQMKGNDYCAYNGSDLFICPKATGQKRGWNKLQRPDVSGVLGFSYEEKLFGQNMILDIRYLYDFTNDSITFGFRNPPIRHRNLIISVGIEF